MSGALWYGPLLPGGAQLLAGASPDVTLALSGQAATASAGTIGVAFGLSATGQAATASAGTLSLQAAIALAGSSGTTSAGTLLPTFSIALVGEAAAGSAGTLVASIVADAGGGGGGIYNGPDGSPYAKPSKDQIDRLKRLLGFTRKEAIEFIERKPEQAALALAVFEISADPDALIDAVLGSDDARASQARLKAAADVEARRMILEWIEDENLTLLLILAGSEW